MKKITYMLAGQLPASQNVEDDEVPGCVHAVEKEGGVTIEIKDPADPQNLNPVNYALQPA